MPGEFRRLADTATGQHGAVTASQIGDAGITASGLRRRVQSGVLERIGSTRIAARSCRPPTAPISPRSCSTAARTRSCRGRRPRRCMASTGSASGPVPRHVMQRPQRAAGPSSHSHDDRTAADRPGDGVAAAGDVGDADADRRRAVRLAGELTAALDSAFRDGLTRRTRCTAGSSTCGRAAGTGSRSSSP